jgi:7-cyano-7-deazaguanine synthase
MDAWRMMSDSNKALVLFSGGIDSATALAWAVKQGWAVKPLCFVYPGRPRREAEAARHLARASGLPAPLEVETPLLRMIGSPRYPWVKVPGAPPPAPDGLPTGYIPHRNLVFYGLALVVAWQEKATRLVGGHIALDGREYADARPPYFEALNALIEQGTPPGLGPPCRIVQPLIGMSKEDCFREAARLGVRLDLTWSCYLDGVKHCGTCANCVDRRLGFQQAGLEDRTGYVSPMPTPA